MKSTLEKTQRERRTTHLGVLACAGLSTVLFAPIAAPSVLGEHSSTPHVESWGEGLTLSMSSSASQVPQLASCEITFELRNESDAACIVPETVFDDAVDPRDLILVARRSLLQGGSEDVEMTLGFLTGRMDFIAETWSESGELVKRSLVSRVARIGAHADVKSVVCRIPPGGVLRATLPVGLAVFSSPSQPHPETHLTAVPLFDDITGLVEFRVEAKEACDVDVESAGVAVQVETCLFEPGGYEGFWAALQSHGLAIHVVAGGFTEGIRASKIVTDSMSEELRKLADESPPNTYAWESLRLAILEHEISRAAGLYWEQGHAEENGKEIDHEGIAKAIETLTQCIVDIGALSRVAALRPKRVAHAIEVAQRPIDLELGVIELGD